MNALPIEGLIGPDALPALVGGKKIKGRGGSPIESVNPANGRRIAAFAHCSAEDVADAVAAAQLAFPGWSVLRFADRAAALLQLAEVVERRGEELASIDVADNGSPIREMRNDVSLSVAQLRYVASLGPMIRGETIPVSHDRLDFTLRQPFGVVGRIVPFNHPLMFAVTKIAAPLIAGNTVILKPSEHTSLSILALVDDLIRIFPPGVVNVVTGYGNDVGDAIVAHPAVRRLAFIGHNLTGRAIQRRAAEVAVKTVTLELGGKNPIVIFPDADLDAAVEGALRGMNFTWQGQSCGSTSRLLVHRDLHDSFVARLAERMASLRSGLPDRAETETGAIVHKAQYDKVRSYIELGREEGGRVVTGGGAPEDPGLADGHFIRPTLFDNVRPDSRLAQEEIFGPVLAAMPFGDYDDALRIANGIQNGLTASVFTRDLGIAHRFARDVEAGFVWVNDSSKHFLGVPYGGVKESGVGREEDLGEVLSYTQLKNVNILTG
ncbi:MAG: aldehyde dehydrogenase family protein [Devosia sp.]|nr:aldehyde dehydrogenase family protein [Devosia sp.]